MGERVATREARSEMSPKSIATRTTYAVVGGLALYFLVLANFDIYRDMLSPYAYKISIAKGHFPWSWPMAFSVALISVVSMALILAVPNHRSVVGVFSHTSFVIIFIPLCAIYTIMDGEFLFVFTCSASLILCYFIFGKVNIVYSYTKTRFDSVIFVTSLCIIIFTVARIYISGHLSFNFVSFDNVYRLRSAASAGISPAADRLVTIAAYTCSSYVLVRGISSKNLIFILIGIIFLYILYSAFGFKIFLFYSLIVFSLYAFFHSNNPLIFLYSILSVFFLIFVVNLFNPPYISSFLDPLNELVIRRYFYTPGYISFAWYETFRSNPLIYMSNIFLLNQIIDYPYNINYSLVVSRFIFNIDFNPNTNIMGYGFANFGYEGIFLYAFLTFFFMWLIDYVSYKMRSSYFRLGALAPTTLFLEADLFVVMISFGLGLVVFIGVMGMLLTRTGKGVG